MKQRLMIAGALVVAASVFYAGSGLIGAQAIELRPDDPAVVSAGVEIYADHCAACHGAKADGRDGAGRDT